MGAAPHHKSVHIHMYSIVLRGDPCVGMLCLRWTPDTNLHESCTGIRIGRAWRAWRAWRGLRAVSAGDRHLGLVARTRPEACLMVRANDHVGRNAPNCIGLPGVIVSIIRSVPSTRAEHAFPRRPEYHLVRTTLVPAPVN
jgi:hypothetical protein